MEQLSNTQDRQPPKQRVRKTSGRITDRFFHLANRTTIIFALFGTSLIGIGSYLYNNIDNYLYTIGSYLYSESQAQVLGRSAPNRGVG
jgi:cytochrome c biogenesis protein CcdA